MTFAPQSPPPVHDPLTPSAAFGIDWTQTGYRERYAPTGPQVVATIMPGRWINDSGALVTTTPVAIPLAHGTNAIQLDRTSGAIVADTAFNADSIPLWLLTMDATSCRILTVIDVRGLAGVPAEG